MNDKKKCNQLCRVCLQTVGEEYKSIFGDKNQSIYKQINEICGISINEHDGLPDKICSPCLVDFRSCVNFKNKCLESNKNLYENITLKVKNEAIKEINECKVNYQEYNEVVPDSSLVDEDSYVIPFKTLRCKYKPQEYPQCNECGEKFKTKCKLRMHWKSIHLNKYLTCSVCKRIFRTFLSYNRHIKRLSGPCYLLAGSVDIRVEVEGSSRVFCCKYCDYKGSTISVLSSHLIRHKEERSHICDICNKGFARKDGLRYHRQVVHFKETCAKPCHVCGKVYSGLRLLTKHLKTHSNSRYQCDICKKIIKNKTSLQDHMLRHSGTKLFTCEFCAAAYYSRPELWNHKQRRHKKSNVKCDLCDYFAPKYRVLIHAKGHNSTHKPVSCIKCGTFVASKEKLSQHMIIHNGEKENSCPLCPQMFFNKHSIRNHLIKKHNTSLTALKNGSLLEKSLAERVISKEIIN